MNGTRIKGYFYLILSGLILIAGGVLVGLQWAMRTPFTVYGKHIEQASTLLIMVCCIAGGLILPLLFRLLFRGMGALREAARAQAREDKLKANVLKEVSDAANADQSARDASG